MALHVEAVRMRRGELTSGSEGRALVDSALERIRTLGVKRPDAFVRMIAPFNAG
jgi:hypothetical protein